MGKVLWIGRFSKPKNKNSDRNVEKRIIDIDQWLYWDNVVTIAFKDEDDFQWYEGTLELKDKIAALIGTILNMWVQDYTYDREKYVSKRDLHSEISSLWETMDVEACTIIETLEYVEWSQWVDFGDEYKLETLERMLQGFRYEVFSTLVSNERVKGV